MITVVKNKRKNRKGNEIRRLNKIRPQDTFFVSKDITTRPRRLSRKNCVENFYLNTSLRASSPIGASEASVARTREQAAKPRGAGERRACNHPLQIFICTSPRRREIPLAEK